MPAQRQKDVLTTGDVARICHVAPRTVSKWFDNGRLRGYRIPGSRDRRIPLPQLVAFMRTHGIPLDELDGGSCRVLIVDGSMPGDLVEAIRASGRHEVATAANGFEAGVQARQFRPHVIVLDVAGGLEGAAAICRNIKASDALNGVKVVAAGWQLTDSAVAMLMDEGFEGYIAKPYTQAKILASVEQAMNLVTS